MTQDNKYTERELLNGFSKGSEHAFTALYNKYYAQVYYFARRIVDDELARDVSIEVFTKLWESKPGFESAAHLLSYLRTLARNSSIDKLRRQNTETERKMRFLELSDKEYEDIYFRDIMEADFYRRILQEVEKLPPHLREIFQLAFYKGLNNGEIAERLSIKDSSVRVGKAQAIKQLRLALGDAEIILLLTLLGSISA